MDVFRVRLNCIDSYQAIPTKLDPILRNDIKLSELQKEPQVPVIRVFGATETGQKVCAHIHGAFPYLYIEYTGSLNSDEVHTHIHGLHLAIDCALAVSYRRNTKDGNAKFVARITLVKGIPFYGFHVGYKYYLKIYMLDPMVMTRLVDLLREGAIMKKVFQPYEAHLQYLLQWMVDYNLYGCDYINCKKVTFRNPVPLYEEMDSLIHLWHDLSIPVELVSRELPRASYCSIEVDICVQDIINRKEIKPRPLHHDFIERLNPLAPDEKLVHSMAGLWRDETRRHKSRMSNVDTGSSPSPEDMVTMSADPRNSQAGGWIHEEEYREKVMSLILDEKNKGDGAKISFNTFVTPTPFETAVWTTLEAVEDLYPENLRPALGLNQGTEIRGLDFENERRGMDEKRILDVSSSDDGSLYDFDEQIMREIDLSQRKREGDLVGGKHLGSNVTKQPEHEIDDELHPCGKKFAEQYVDPCDPSSLEDSAACPSGLFEARDFDTLLPAHENSSVPEPLLKTQKAFSINANDNGARFTSTNDLKRPDSLVNHDEVYRKRQRVSQGKDKDNGNISVPDFYKAETTTGEHSKSLDRLKDGLNSRHARTSKSKLLTENGYSLYNATKKISTETSITSAQPLNLPVVKNPQEPSTLSRLSQGSASRASSLDKKKNILFDPSPTSQTQSSFEGNPHLTPSNASSAIEPSTPISNVIKSIEVKFGRTGGTLLTFSNPPPSCIEVVSTMQQFNLPPVVYQDAFYSNEKDVPGRVREWAGKEFKLESTTVPFLPDFDPTGTSDATFGEKPAIIVDRVKEEAIYKRRRHACGLRSWAIADPPPTYSEVENWLYEEKAGESGKAGTSVKEAINSRPAFIPWVERKLSQIDGPTQKNRHGFKFTQNQKSTSVIHEAQYMSTLSLEIHINTRGNLVPNPEEDEVQCLFWCLNSGEEGFESNGIAEGTHLGIVALGAMSQKITRQVAIEVQEETSELDVMIRMVEIVRTLDPDILTGYEIHGGSWGYLIERARLKYDYNLCDEFSRMKTQSHGRFGKENDKWGFNNTSTIRVTGRHTINIWRAMRGELNLLQYTMENVVFHLLHRRIPHFTWADLTKWYTNDKPRDLAKVISHYISRVQLDLEILERNELISRTSEQARLLGVDFFSVFSRGSQYKVESLMFRIAKPENFLLISPSRRQVGGQNALECLPLVIEPQSAFYNSPVLVLDFQSLYPSVMIAYNYCYSTFLGRIVKWRGQNKMGFTEYKRQQRLLELLKDYINIAPNGIMYTKPEIRKSLLAKMLGEILETRVMVKSGMKADKDDKSLQRLLNNRQLALKLIANVTYGYTSASFSGRMPCSEIADSIVQTGRETLEKAIALIHSVQSWGAEVVYGDTDSIFVHLKGRTKDQAFDIGEEIAKTITNMSPRPVKLKFEKVYLPCVLLAKKRYVGFKYEHKDQTEPDFDAKGIETVRRDGTPAEQKIEEKALKILFRTADLSQVKAYFQKQCEKIMRGSVSIQDFCFAKEVKLGSYMDKGPPPPGALISTKRMLEDARAEPQYGERVPYVVIAGAPGARLINRCVAPEELIENEHNELDAEYYISKNIIPPLERIFNLVGANVRNWYDEMPKIQRIRKVDAKLKRTIESYMQPSSCLICQKKRKPGGSLCSQCMSDKPVSMLTLRTRLNAEERKYMDLQKVCQSCSGISPLDEVKCDSKDCPVFYTRTRQRARLKSERAMVEPAMKELCGGIMNMEDMDW